MHVLSDLLSTKHDTLKSGAKSFRSTFTLNVNGENVIKYHVILSMGNIQGKLLTFLTFGTTVSLHENSVGSYCSSEDSIQHFASVYV